ncbi:AMP-binding protein [Emcibacter nanhaiensis]|uniref:Propionyl-CoA synthetase n=1 Tax=Emcibacter nanhaiensis TaxID=1505037 RepID=A0A501PID5_9PROT|nr:AMP-binding protein [Emcibacter nanhaiensis]TPD60209.1 propionyl-CoA synthetase [Emcibacter nanhaiensis]
MSGYENHLASWRASPETFWKQAAEQLDWDIFPTRILQQNDDIYRWFADGRLSACYNLIDRHVDAGRGEQAALVYDSPMTGSVKSYSYNDLLDEVSRLAGAFQRAGVEQGDRVVIYMPMVPEAVFAMLACCRIGAVHSVVFGGFAARELAKRIDDATPKLVLSASCGLEPGRVVAYKPLLEEALDLSTHKPDLSVILQRPEHEADLQDGDAEWQEFVEGAEPADCVVTKATDPLYVLYTSGTTGVPKGVVRDVGGYLTALSWSMKQIYGMAPGEAYWAASDIGWVVGHSYIVYAPLLVGCTTILYEGKPIGTPDPGAFWRVIEDHKVKVLFTAPTALRAIKKEDPTGSYKDKYDLSSLRHLFLAGERADPDSLIWAHKLLGVPVIDHWWQTETGWPAIGNFAGAGLKPVKPGSAGLLVPGYDFHVLNEDHEELSAGQIGDLAIKLPLPPGCLPTLWHNEEGFKKSYLTQHPGYYSTGDAGFIDEDGYISIMSRTDDLINVAGHRLSTGAMEEVISNHPKVAECAVIGVNDAIKGALPVAFVVLFADAEEDAASIGKELIASVRHEIGPVAALKHVIAVARLPKTRSGKILRGTMRSMANGEEFTPPATIDDPAILDEIRDYLSNEGYPQ